MNSDFQEINNLLLKMIPKNSMGTLLYMPDLNNNKQERNE